MGLVTATDSPAVTAVEAGGMTDSLGTAPEEAVETISGVTGLVGGVQAVALGAVLPAAAEVSAEAVLLMDLGTLAESAEVGHGAALSAGEVPAFILEEVSAEDSEEALVAMV